MYHDRTLAARVKADPRPVSAVSTGAGLAGLAGLIGWVAVARWFGMDGPYAALVDLACCAVPMVSWSLAIDKVHRNPTTGIDWAQRSDTFDISITKLAGFWATWAGMTAIYATFRFYWTGNFAFAMWCFVHAAPVLLILSVPYVLWLDRRLIEPHDGAWHLGALLTGQRGVDRDKVYDHLRAWGVKTFFLAFMLAGMPGGFGEFIRWDWHAAMRDPAGLANWLITFMFVIDMALATAGYMLTFRPLDSHIRSANPFAAAWMAALICYPPSILMSDGGPLDYRPGTQSWDSWFAAHPVLIVAWGAMLVVLTAIYAWATVAFGPRFSNLTHRGILTHGPYSWARHPAYLAKNAFWWLSTLPILSLTSAVDAARATAILAAVSGVYYWRAKTEERHLGLDPGYREYSDWIARNGLLARMRGRSAART